MPQWSNGQLLWFWRNSWCWCGLSPIFFISVLRTCSTQYWVHCKRIYSFFCIILSSAKNFNRNAGLQYFIQYFVKSTVEKENIAILFAVCKLTLLCQIFTALLTTLMSSNSQRYIKIHITVGRNKRKRRNTNRHFKMFFAVNVISRVQLCGNLSK